VTCNFKEPTNRSHPIMLRSRVCLRAFMPARSLSAFFRAILTALSLSPSLSLSLFLLLFSLSLTRVRAHACFLSFSPSLSHTNRAGAAVLIVFACLLSSSGACFEISKIFECGQNADDAESGEEDGEVDDYDVDEVCYCI